MSDAPVSRQEFLTALERQEKFIAEAMENGFRTIAAEIKNTVADRDMKIYDKMNEMSVQIARIEENIKKKDREVTKLFEQTDHLRAKEEEYSILFAQHSGTVAGEKTSKQGFFQGGTLIVTIIGVIFTIVAFIVGLMNG